MVNFQNEIASRNGEAIFQVQVQGECSRNLNRIGAYIWLDFGYVSPEPWTPWQGVVEFNQYYFSNFETSSERT